MRLLVASYNIQYGLGQDKRFDIGRIADAVAEADIVLFQEVCQHWTRNEGEDQVAAVADRLNRYVVFGSTVDMDASSMEDGRVVNRRKTFGNMVASRWPILSSRTQLLPKLALPDVMDVQRCAVEAVIRTPAGALRAYSVHLSHISTGQRLPQIDTLLEFVRRGVYDCRPFDGAAPAGWETDLAGLDLPLPSSVLIGGDFNCTPDSDEYARLCGEWHAKRGRMRRADQFVDTWAAAGLDPFAPTTHDSRPAAYKIDHVLATPDLAAAVTRSWVETEVTASDHYPLFVELDWAG